MVVWMDIAIVIVLSRFVRMHVSARVGRMQEIRRRIFLHTEYVTTEILFGMNQWVFP